jgi:hypothetical protein
MPDAYVIEVFGRTAGIVARDSQSNSFNFFSAAPRFNAIEGQRFSDPLAAERAARMLAKYGSLPRRRAARGLTDYRGDMGGIFFVYERQAFHAHGHVCPGRAGAATAANTGATRTDSICPRKEDRRISMGLSSVILGRGHRTANTGERITLPIRSASPKQRHQ